MAKKKSNAAQRAWNILRLALLWARKGGVFKRRLMMDLRLLPRCLKSLRQSNDQRSAIHYGERELSFDDTPIIHIKMHRPSSMRFRLPHIPCINPQADFDYDFEFNDENDDDTTYYNDEGRTSFLQNGDEEDNGCEVCEEMVPCEDEGIDIKAEEFIAKFYEQMKLQRQISYLQYNEMLNRAGQEIMILNLEVENFKRTPLL
ncbi:hypothetical protein F0562_021459 [Nyssa sinensis]|uniref:DUF761 domain-containing protein n=1 Tax=Nyssa sinensis TaxID=561372 RepID=A0A5J5BK35_9ASTE|nr:hypothetical protein F0562_021459 [Nyssa sinensis]